MNLFENPFYILKATTRDNRRRLMELSDEMSLSLDSSVCQQARADLTNPRKRLTAEVAWLPGLDPKRVETTLSRINNDPAMILDENSFSPLAKANVLAEALSRLPFITLDDVSRWLVELATAFERIDAEDVLELVDEEREVAGFPELTDISSVQEEINGQRNYYRQMMNAALHKLDDKERTTALTRAVESTTDIGEKECPALLADLVDDYEVESQDYLNGGTTIITGLIKKVKADAVAKVSKSTMDTDVNRLIQAAKNWDFVAQPVQVVAKSRGDNHANSQQVAHDIRELAIYLNNKHGLTDIAIRLTAMSQEVFAELVDVAEQLEDDAKALNKLVRRQEELEGKNKECDEKWAREITFEAKIGFLFKDKLKISPAGIDWIGRRFTLDSITKIMWGKISKYSVSFGTKYQLVDIPINDREIYMGFVSHLWRAVGVRLLIEMLKNLRDGGSCTFDDTEVFDTGIKLTSFNLFSANDHVLCPWNEVQLQSDGIFLTIQQSTNTNLSVTLCYTYVPNVHVLETAIRMLKDRGILRLSDLLNG